MMQPCFDCGKEFDTRGVTQCSCPECRRQRREQQATESLGKRGSLCYSLIPGHWSPCFVDGVLVEHLGDGKILVDCEDGVVRESTIGNFSRYLEQQPERPKLQQLNLFVEVAL